MLLRFIKNLKRSTFNDESLTGKSFRTTTQTVIRVGVPKHLFKILIKILIDRRSYLYKFYSNCSKFDGQIG